MAASFYGHYKNCRLGLMAGTSSFVVRSWSGKRFDIYVQLRLPVWALRIGRLFAAFLRVSFVWQSFQPVQFFCFLDTLNGIRTGERLLELWHVIYQKIYLELTPSVSHQ